MYNNRLNDKQKSTFWKKYKYIIILSAWTIIPYFLLFFLKNKVIRDNIFGILEIFKKSSGLIINLAFILILFLIIIIIGSTPGILLSAYVYGFWKGSIIGIIITYLSTILFYYLSRNVFSKDFTHYIKNNSFLKKYINLFHKDSNKLNKNIDDKNTIELVALTRLSPILPHNSISMFWGITKIKTTLYLLGTLGLIPFGLLTGLLGSKFKSIKQLFDTDKLQLLIYIIITVIICYIIQIKVEKMLVNMNKEISKSNKID